MADAVEALALPTPAPAMVAKTGTAGEETAPAMGAAGRVFMENQQTPIQGESRGQLFEKAETGNATQYAKRGQLYGQKIGENGRKKEGFGGGERWIGVRVMETKNPQPQGVTGFIGWHSHGESNPSYQNEKQITHTGQEQSPQPLATKPETARLPMRLPERAEPGTNRPEESARPAAIGTDETARANPANLSGIPTNRPATIGQTAPAIGGTEPGQTANPCQTPAPGGLAAIVDALRDELAAQRAENAALRKTIEALTATIAKLAGGR